MPVVMDPRVRGDDASFDALSRGRRTDIFQTTAPVSDTASRLAARGARGVHELFRPGKQRAQGNAGCPLHPQPRAQSVGSTRVSSPQVPRITRHSLRNGFNGLFRALPGDRACLSPSLANMVLSARSGSQDLRKLDAGVEASGPHDFAVRTCAVRQRALIAHRPKPALPSRPTLKRCRVHRIPPRVRDDRDTPLQGTRRRGI
jgi:hypothetical protein